MRNYITLNGKNSNEINGLLIQELPPISKPQIRTEVEEIDGRDGDIVTKLGFAAYDKEFTVGLYKDFDINAIIAYFNSEGTVVFSNEPDKYYNYQIIDQIDFERLVRYRTATVRMHCQPFKYSNTEGARTLGNKGTASGEGSFITLDNTPEAQFSKIEPKGNATQTTYSGKNLLPMINTTRTVNGVTFTPRADGSIALSGTASAQTNYPINVDSANISRNIQLSAGTYTISWGSTPSSSGMFVQAYYTVDGGSGQYSTGTFTVSGTQATLGAYIRVNNGTNTNGTVIYPMLESGSTATSYEPYVGGTASPNPDYPQAVNTVTGEQTVKIEGKNLFDINRTLGEPSNTAYANTTPRTFDFAEYVKGISSNNYYAPNNITSFDVSNGNITLKTTQSAYGLGFAVPALPSTTYRISYTVTPAGGIASIGYYQKTGEWISNYSPSNGVFITPANCDFIVVSFRGSGDNVETTYSNIQLELGSTTTAYEPYQGQTLPVNLGKNLFYLPENISTTVNNIAITGVQGQSAFTLNGTNSGSAVSAQLVRTYVPLKLKAGTYTGKIVGLNSSATTLDRIYIAKASSIGTPIKSFQPSNDWSGTFTLDEDIEAGFTIIFDAGSSYSNKTVTIQIEKGSTATTYAPYFTPIELAKIGNYQDRIYKDDGKWYIEKQVGKVVLDGTENWALASMFYCTSPLQNIAECITPSGGNVMSNYFTWSSGAQNNHTIDIVGAYIIRIRDTDFADVSALTTWLSTHNTTVYYALAEPVNEEITNEALISQLEALYNQAHAYKGRTHVAAIAQGSNAPHIIEAEVQRSSDGNITNNGNIVSKPTLTIYGSGNIGVSLNGYQILEITLGDEEYITIDTAAMEAYKDTLDNLKNRLVNGDYSKFALRPGSNRIEFSGTVSKCVISKYSRWL